MPHVWRPEIRIRKSLNTFFLFFFFLFFIFQRYIIDNNLLYSQFPRGTHVNEFILFSILCIFIIDIIAIGIFTNFYIETRRKSFDLIIPGWICHALGQLTPLLAESIPDVILSQFSYLSFGVLTSVGVFMIGIGLISYFIKIPRSIVLVAVIASTIFPIVIWLTMGLKIALNASLTSFGIALIATYVAPALNWKKFKELIGKSILLYYISIGVVGIFAPVTFLTLFRGHAYGLFFSNDQFLIMLNYCNVIIGVILMIMYFVHVEFSITNQERFELKDSYSHNMGNNLQAISLTLELIKMKPNLTSSEQLEMAQKLEAKLDDSLQFLEEIKKLK